MGTFVIVKNTDAERSNGKLILPVMRGLKAIFLPNTETTKLRNNFAIEGIDAEVVGAPEISAGSTRFKGEANFLQTMIAEDQEFTIISAHKNATVPTGTANACVLAATYKSYRIDQPTILTFGCSMYSLNNTSISLGATRDNAGTLTSSGITLNDINTSSWGLYSATVESAKNTLRSHTANKSQEANFTFPRVQTSGNFRIGSDQNEPSTYTGEIDVGAFIYANVIWTDAERSQNAEAIRRIMGKYGIAV